VSTINGWLSLNPYETGSFLIAGYAEEPCKQCVGVKLVHTLYAWCCGTARNRHHVNQSWLTIETEVQTYSLLHGLFLWLVQIYQLSVLS
jgi:hypothetical protein